MTLSSGICIGAVAMLPVVAWLWCKWSATTAELFTACAQARAANEAVSVERGRAKLHSDARIDALSKISDLLIEIDSLQPLANIGRARKASLDRASAKKREARK